jgi:flagella basal body P-ring formation protein FlgA
MEHPPRPWDVPRGERVIVLALEGQIMIMLSLKPNALSSGIIRQGIKDRTLLQVSS